jgi:macrolide transport system ATP-binding/permease protein
MHEHPNRRAREGRIVVPLPRWHRLFAKPHLRLIALLGLIVPRRLRADWRQEWETELQYRETMLADWDQLNGRHKLDLLKRSTSAFWDALSLQRKRLEADVIRDVRYGVRMLFIRPGFTAVASLTLALGIGANTAIFSLLDRVFIRQLPVEQPDQLVTFIRDAGGEPKVFSYPTYSNLRDRNDVLSGLVASSQQPFSLTDGTRTERMVGQLVSGNYFAVLGVRPALGRFFLPEEDRTPGTHPVVVLGHGLWRRRFAADPAMIGKTIGVNGYRYTVIGIAPSEFTGTTRGTETDVYVPVMMHAQVMPGSAGLITNGNWGWARLIGRLKPNVSRERAQAALSILVEQSATPGSGPKKSEKFLNAMALVDGSRGHMDRVRDLSVPLKLLMGMVGFVLLIACSNVANLLLARASTRSKEIAVRLAVGASHWRIVRQLLTEGILLAAMGGAAGVLVAQWVTGALLLRFQQQTSAIPRMVDGGLDGRALGFTFGLSLLTGIVFSLAPALHTSKSDYVSALKNDMAGAGSGWRRPVLRNLLVVAQVALSLVVLIGAGLCVKSLRALQAVDPGLEPAKVVTASFDLKLNGYDEARGRQFMADLSDRAAALPGVEAVSFANIVAFSDLFWISGAAIEGYQPQPNERLAFDFNAISPGYFHTIGTPLVEGREFGSHDSTDAPRVVIVNEAAARRYWPGQAAVGKRTSRGQVVGVVRNSKEKGLAASPRPAMFLPLLQSYAPELTLHVRTATEPQALLAGVRREVQALDPTLPLYNLSTLAVQKDGSLYAERTAAALLTLFGLLALLVTAVGIYGLLSHTVTERTREMGIRLACGAQPRDLFKLVLGQGMLLTLVGLVAGVAASFALTRLMARLLFGVSPTDPLTFAAIPLLLAVVALLACCVPARRATRMNPLVVLRYE